MDEKKEKFTCRHMELTPDGKTIFLKEDVEIKTEKLFIRADSAVFNNETQTLITFGTREMIFSGGEAIINEQAGNTLRYKLNDSKIYVE